MDDKDSRRNEEPLATSRKTHTRSPGKESSSGETGDASVSNKMLGYLDVENMVFLSEALKN